ncbi:MAG TPA: ISAs1 family transposase [Blastocatellia bacterium]|nr:ISAs1 family transposase [Blastocatellia bacterium]
MSPEKVSAECVTSLIACFADLPDPRIKRCRRHPLINIVVIGLCAVICGGAGPSDMETFGEERREWLQQFLELPDGIPSHDTFGRILSLIAPTEFARCLRHWITTHIRLSEGEIVALDGKTLRGSQRRPLA